MEKTVVIGDIHGKDLWKAIIDKEKPSRVIFLGDYVSTHGTESATAQLENLVEILDYKESHDCIMLRGNHDLQHLGYAWAACSQWDPQVYAGMYELKERFLRDTQWVYSMRVGNKDFIFSHAGISEVWLRDSLGITLPTPGWVDMVNSLPPSELFGFIPNNRFDTSGDSVTQSPVWIRPFSLMKCMPRGYNQVVGHTPCVKQCFNMRTTLGTGWMGHPDTDLWIGDGLDRRSYLVITKGEVIEKKI